MNYKNINELKASVDSQSVKRLNPQMFSSIHLGPDVGKILVPGPDRETDLHDQIMDWCRGMGFYYVHSRTDRRTTQAPGVPDFIIAADHGRTVWIECKRKGSKPTPAQLAAQAHLNKLGHLCEIVHTMEEFLSVMVYGKPNPPSSPV